MWIFEIPVRAFARSCPVVAADDAAFLTVFFFTVAGFLESPAPDAFATGPLLNTFAFRLFRDGTSLVVDLGIVNNVLSDFSRLLVSI